MLFWKGPNALMWHGKALSAGSPLPEKMTPERIVELKAFIGDDSKGEKPKAVELKSKKRGKQ